MPDTRDKQVQKTARLHERAVQAVARGDVAPTPARRRRGAQNGSQSRNQAVHKHLIVDPQVMKKAKELLVGTYTRIEIVDAETVMVR